EHAERTSFEAFEFGQQRDDVSGVHGLQMFFIRREQQRLGELEPVVRMLMQLNPSHAMWRPGLVLLLADIDMADDARSLLAELVADDLAAIPRDILFQGSLCFLAEAA